MLRIAFNSDMFAALDCIYPGVFKRWELGKHVRNNYWTEKEGILKFIQPKLIEKVKKLDY